MVSQIIKPQAVLFFVHNGAQLMLELLALGRVQQALKHGILNTLPIIHALFRDLPEPLFARRVLRVHIVRDQHQHTLASFP